MLCEVCCEHLPNEPAAVKLLAPCNHRMHTRCHKEGEPCKACANEQTFHKVLMWALMLFLGIAFGLLLAPCILDNQDPLIVLSRNIRNELAQLETIGETTSFFVSPLRRIHVMASLQRIHAVVKHEALHCRSSANDK
jgi:hypothetical protein